MSLTIRGMSRSHWPRVIDKDYAYMMIDIVVLPGGKRFLLDEDELEQALRVNDITREQHDKAYLTANEIMKELDEDMNYVKVICNTYFHTLKNQYK